MATSAQVDVRVGLDVGKGEHFADVLDDDGEWLFARAVVNDQADREALRDLLAAYPTLTALRAASQLAMLRTGQHYQPAPGLPKAA